MKNMNNLYRNFKVVKAIFITLLCTSLFSCTDLANTKEFLKQLEDNLFYENSDLFTIRLSSDGGRISPSGDYSVKVTDQIGLLFTPEADKFFEKWNVYLNDELLDDEEAAKYVEFEDITSSETKVKILKKVDNLKIQAQLTLRPTVVFTLPQGGEKNVVRNRSISIIFSKPIDAKKLKEYVHIYEGVQYFTNQDIVYEKKDASSKVDFILSDSKKTLIIRLKNKNLFNPSNYVSVYIDKDLCDSGKASMENDYELQFMTGNEIDTIAPMISNLDAGCGDYFKGMEVKGMDDNQFTITDTSVANDYFGKVRSGIINANDSPKVNIYVQSGDVLGTKENHTDMPMEPDVDRIIYRYTKYVANRDGVLTACQTSDNYYLIYRPGDFSDDSMRVNSEEDEVIKKLKNNKTGCIASIDLKTFEDGLYRFDISAEDKNGNSGFDENCWLDEPGYSNTWYKSIFVVKNSCKPNVKAIKWYRKDSVKHGTYDYNVESLYSFKNTSDGTKVLVDNHLLGIQLSDVKLGIKSIKFDVKQENGTSVTNQNGKNFSVSYCESSYYKKETRDQYSATVSDSKDNTALIKDYSLPTINDGYIFISGLELGKVPGKVTVTATLTDLFGNEQVLDPIVAYNDQKAPNFKDDTTGNYGPRTVNYAYQSGEADKHVWPRPGNLGVLSTEFLGEEGKGSIKNKDGVPVRWFYTNARENNDYGVRLTWDVEEDRKNVYWEYIRSDYITNGTPLSDAKLSEAPSGSYTTGGSLTGTGGSLSYTFKPGLWHIRLRDEVNNYSKIYTFVVVADHARPAINLDNGDTLLYAITLDDIGNATVKNNGSSCEDKGCNLDTNNSAYFNWWESNSSGHGGSALSVSTITITGKQSEIQGAKLKVKLTGNASGLLYWGETNKLSNSTYKECKPSRTSSGLAQYCMSWAWGDWNTGNQDAYIPAYPEAVNTSIVDARGGKYTIDRDVYKEYETWHDYISGTDISWNLYHKWGSLERYNYMPPVVLFLKDQCGNINWISLRQYWEGDHYNFRWKFDYTD